MGYNRNARLDFIKGTATFLVLWGHIIQYGISGYYYDDALYRLIYSFHMPVFMAISGYFLFKSLKNNTFSTLVKKKVTTILYPCVIWGGIQEIVVYIRDFPSNKTIGEIIMCSFTDIWFMWTLFWISIICMIALKVSSEHIIPLCFFLLMGAVLLFFIPNNEANLFMYPYFLLGLFYSKYETYWPKINQRVIGIGSIVLFVVMSYGYSSNRLISVGRLYITGNGSLYNDLYRYCIGVIGAVAYIYGQYFIYDNLSTSGKIMEGVLMLSRCSAELYCFQNVAIAIIGSSLLAKLTSMLGFNPISFNAFVFETLTAPALSLLFIKVFIRFMNFLKRYEKIYKILWGKW